MRIGVLSDTHVPDRADELPGEIFHLFRGVDMILHAGDLCQKLVLDALEAIAPVLAVRGNRDDCLPELPEKQIISIEGWRIGLIHGTRPRRQEFADRLRYLVGDRRFDDERLFVRRAFAGIGVHCIVFGHTHQACNETEAGVLLFNPGGVVPAWRGGPGSVGILDISCDGITGHVIRLRHPPRPLPLRKRLWRSWHRD